MWRASAWPANSGVPYASILSDHGRAAGRTGMGALMGSKNLKAMAVRGTGKLAYARDEEYKRLRVEANKALREENITAVYRETGTAGGSRLSANAGRHAAKVLDAGHV